MSEGFDPYHHWLGIPLKEQPPDHYRLLGVQRFEPNADVIANAADRYTAFVHSFKNGPHASASQQLVGELAAARTCLLNPAMRAEYDAQLRATTASAGSSISRSPVAPPPPAFPVSQPPATPLMQAPLLPATTPPAGYAPGRPVAPVQALPAGRTVTPVQPLPRSASSGVDETSEFSSFAERRDRPAAAPTNKGGNPIVTLVGIVAGGVVGVGIALLMLPYITGRSNVKTVKAPEATTRPKPAAPPRPSFAPNRETPKRSASSGDSVLTSPDLNPDAFAPTPNSEPFSAGADAFTPMPRPEMTGVEFHTGPFTFPMPGGAPPSGPATFEPPQPGEWINLLEWGKDIDWRSRGIDWNANVASARRKGVALLQKPDNLYPLPAIIDGDYELEVMFTRRAGNDSVGIFFPVGLHNVTLDLSPYGGVCDGIDSIDGKRSNDGVVARRPSKVVTGTLHVVHILVRTNGDHASFNIDFDDVKNYLQWEGHLNSLIPTGQWKLTTVRRPWLGTWNTETEFHRVRLRMLTGSVRRDAITSWERIRDWDGGFVRLIGEPYRNATVGWSRLMINQNPPDWTAEINERYWPLVSADPRPCKDYYGAHAQSKVVGRIPDGAKSFSVVGYNMNSRTTKYQVVVEGKQIYDSDLAAIDVIKVDLPPGSQTLDLIIDQSGDNGGDNSYWCYPRFHRVSASDIPDAALDGKPLVALPFTVASHEVGYAAFTRNEPLGATKTIERAPINFRDAVPCDEFVFAHAPSSITYSIPDGLTRFTAVGYAVGGAVKFVVVVDGREVHRSDVAGIAPIDLHLPPGSKELILKVDDVDGGDYDRSMWCYPRLHRQ